MSKVGKQLIKMLKEEEWTFDPQFDRRLTHPASGFRLWSDGKRVCERGNGDFADPVDLPISYIEKWYALRLIKKYRQRRDNQAELAFLARMAVAENRLPE